MSRLRIASTILAALCTFAISLRGAAQSTLTAPQLTDEHIQKAITAIVNELVSRKQPERFWDPEKVPVGESTRQKGGYTALSVLALLSAGQSYQDPRLRDAVDYLAGFTMEGTYAVTLRTGVWARLPARYSANLSRDAQWLFDGFSQQSSCWDYVQDPRTKYQDNSIRQFGALALWEAAKRGINVDRNLWQKLEDAYISMQQPDGGWNYRGDGPATGSMTAAGLATLFITQDFLHASESIKLGQAKTPAHQLAIERGLQWMDEHFSPTENPGKNTYFYYYLYGVERVGLASGYATFGNRDWFRLGAAELIDRLCKWDEATATFSIHRRTRGDGRAGTIKVDDLAFGLMFLSRGRVPVAINKLAFDGAWNNRPRDAANLTRWIADHTESQLSWQIVRLSGEPERWLDAPLLYIASNEPLPMLREAPSSADEFVNEAREFLRRRSAGEIPMDARPPARPEFAGSADLDKLKRYLDLGGMIFALNEGPSQSFATSIEKAGRLMFPQFEWHTVPEDHWAYTVLLPVKSRQPPLKVLSNGVRDLIVLSPAGDLPAVFQANETKNEAVFQTAANVYFYASEVNRPRPRLAHHRHESGTSPATQPLSGPTIVRAIHEGQWKPEPLALNVFADVMRFDRGMDITIVDHPLAMIAALDSPPALVIVSGIEAHTFTEAQTAAIKAYVESGGVILFETPGGRGEFAASAERMMQELFGQAPSPLGNSRIITGLGLPDAANLARVDYRPYSLQTFATRENSPRLRGIVINGEPLVLLSAEDISNALLDQPCWGVSGYSPQSARDLLANVVQHAIALRQTSTP